MIRMPASARHAGKDYDEGGGDSDEDAEVLEDAEVCGIAEAVPDAPSAARW
jgi:hypothetical protein